MSGLTVTTTHYVESICKAMEKEAPITWASMRNGMLLADQDEDRQFRNLGGPQVCGLHADIPLFQLFESNSGSEVVRVIDEWSIEFGHHGIDGADVHGHPPLPVPFRGH